MNAVNWKFFVWVVALNAIISLAMSIAELHPPIYVPATIGGCLAVALLVSD